MSEIVLEAETEEGRRVLALLSVLAREGPAAQTGDAHAQAAYDCAAHELETLMLRSDLQASVWFEPGADS